MAVPVEIVPGRVRNDVTIELDQQVQSPLAETRWAVRWRGRLRVAGKRGRVSRDLLPDGTLEFFSTGGYRVTPLFPLTGRWTPRGKHRLRHQIEPEVIQELFNAGIEITRVNGRGRANKNFSRIRGRIVARGRVVSPIRARLVARFRYRAVRIDSAREPGRLPLIPPEVPG